MKFARWFIYSAALVLLLTAAAKFISSAGSARILLEHDSLTDLRFRNLFPVIGGIEVAVALVCIFGKRISFPVGLVAWLATNFLAYRIGLVAVGYHQP